MSQPPQAARVLVVDDDLQLLSALLDALEAMGYEAAGEAEPAAGLRRVPSWQPDAVITDLKMPSMDGVELARKIHEEDPELPVVILTGQGSIESAVQAMKEGVYDYLLKPFDLDAVDLTLRKAIDHSRHRRQARMLAESMGRVEPFEGIVGHSAPVRALLEAITTVAATDSTVLVVGESGTGKELIARAIHAAGPRADKPFVTVDCAAVSESLLESELFGHSRGAFTGAHRERPGYFEVALNGTVFLDEIGEIRLPLQKKLLRVLEEKTFSRVGETRRRNTAARVVAATNRDLAREMADGRFREDLYYRLNVIKIQVPALRERREDIPLLVEHYVELLARKMSRRVRRVSPRAMDVLLRYPWPGNVRELVNLLEQLVTFHDVEILDLAHLPPHLSEGPAEALPEITYTELKRSVLDQAGSRYFAALLLHYRGNVTRVAEHAGTNRRHIHRLLGELNIDPGDYRSR